MPSVKDLEFAVTEAGKKRGGTVELPWGTEASTYILTVVDPPGPGQEPFWSLFQGEAMQDLLWKHASRDLALIHSLVFQAVPDDMASSGGFGAASLSASVGGGTLSAPADTSKASLSGRIENMGMATLVQSIEMSKMSGRLYLYDKGSGGQIFFSEGIPVHASTAESVGDQAVIEAMTWEQGDFRFFPEESTEERTVKRRMGGMIMEGITLLDQRKFLNGQGLKPESYLIRKDQQITQEEFRSRLSKGAPLDIMVQKGFYDLVDGRSRLQDILQRKHMTKAEWIPILFNMVSCGFITIADSSPFGGQAQGLAGADIDRSMVHNVVRALVRAETGMFTYPAFLFFLEQEFAKSVVLAMPLSILVFEVRLAAGEAPQPLPLPALREVAQRIEALKRPFDILAHYETFDFALILPGAPARKARVLANMIAEALVSGPLVPNSTARLLLACGVASSPEDSQELPKLIAAAKEAKNKAKEQRVPAKMFSELVDQKH